MTILAMMAVAVAGLLRRMAQGIASLAPEGYEDTEGFHFGQTESCN